MKTPILWAATTILCAVPLLGQQSGPSPSGAPDVPALQQQIRDLQDRIISLEGQMRMLRGTQPATTAQAAAAPQVSAPAAPAPEIPAAGVTGTGDQTPTLGGAGGHRRAGGGDRAAHG